MSSDHASEFSNRLGLAATVVDAASRGRSVKRFRDLGIRLPTFDELARPETIAKDVRGQLNSVGRDEAHAANLYRVHWHNQHDRSQNEWLDVPEHVVLSKEFTGVDAPIIVAFGEPFPMINAHKVLAAYSCLAPRVITGQFDPTRHKAIWPSTGNYARGGVAISRIMASRGVAILPEGMSQERFDWLDQWISDPSDVIRTHGTESNVKEIYDACNELAKDSGNFVLNQFCEFGNYIGHVKVTGTALGRIFEHVAGTGSLSLAAFVSATGSAGTIGAGDHLKTAYGTKIVAVEALECPTMLENGYGEHNIQGIGDKHIPLIHNVMNTDIVVGISDRATDELDLTFNSPNGLAYLADRMGWSPQLIGILKHFGFSSICNILAAIKTAKHLELGENQAVITIATDGAALYPSERAKLLANRYHGSFDQVDAAHAVGQHLTGADTQHLIELTERDRKRIFNLGYFTWVEQQGLPLEIFDARLHQSFWTGMHSYADDWDQMIVEFNAEVSAAS